MNRVSCMLASAYRKVVCNPKVTAVAATGVLAVTGAAANAQSVVTPVAPTVDGFIDVANYSKNILTSGSGIVVAGFAIAGAFGLAYMAKAHFFRGAGIKR